MIYSLENDFLIIKINSYGSELSSIVDKSDGYEYIWQGNSEYWEGKAPILFPIVGNLHNDKYQFEGKEYFMQRHGFARSMDFSLIDYTDSKINLILTPSYFTMLQYPFQFRLLVSYTLKDRTLTTGYTVENIGEKTLWFSIGGHPGFCCSVKTEGTKNCRLLFPEKETVNYIENEQGYLTGREKPFIIDQNTLDVSSINFDGKTKVYILKDLKSDQLILQDLSKGKKVCIGFRDFSYIGIWSPCNEAPFICIEPWHGITSTLGVKSDLNRKLGIRSLDEDECFCCSFDIICE